MKLPSPKNPPTNDEAAVSLAREVVCAFDEDKSFGDHMGLRSRTSEAPIAQEVPSRSKRGYE